MTFDPILGLWIADHHTVATKAAYLDDLKDLGFQTVAIMIGNHFGQFTWPQGAVMEMVDGLIERDIEAVLTVWTPPVKETIDTMLRWLDDVGGCGISAIEDDIEGRFRERDSKGRPLVKGFSGIPAASLYVVDGMMALCDRHDLRFEVTTHTGHREHGEDALITPYAHRRNFQWYSVRKRNKKTIAWNSKYGPGRMQAFGAQKASKVPVAECMESKLCVGLAAWSQRWPGHKPQEAMQVAYNAALLSEPVEVRYWDSRRIVGSKPNCYSRDFIISLQG